MEVGSLAALLELLDEAQVLLDRAVVRVLLAVVVQLTSKAVCRHLLCLARQVTMHSLEISLESHWALQLDVEAGR